MGGTYGMNGTDWWETSNIESKFLKTALMKYKEERLHAFVQCNTFTKMQWVDEGTQPTDDPNHPDRAADRNSTHSRHHTTHAL
jgi:hypothetical protein